MIIWASKVKFCREKCKIFGSEILISLHRYCETISKIFLLMKMINLTKKTIYLFQIWPILKKRKPYNSDFLNILHRSFLFNICLTLTKGIYTAGIMKYVEIKNKHYKQKLMDHLSVLETIFPVEQSKKRSEKFSVSIFAFLLCTVKQN